MESPVYVTLEFTPNPNTLKYSVNRDLLPSGVLNFTAPSQAEGRSPLAMKLFSIKGISAIMIGKDFVTVTKADEGDWDTVHQEAARLLEAHLKAGEPIVLPHAADDQSLASVVSQSGQSEVAKGIISLIEREIRPAVAMDGGDIAFEKYENGVVYLSLKGSCSGCPSSRATLKHGIEARLKQLYPEIQEVVSL